MEIALKLLLLLGALCHAQSQNWTYAEQDQWQADNPARMCNGTRQSPIRIHTIKAIHMKSYPSLNFTNYDEMVTVMIENNGHTAEITYPMNSTLPEISGGPLEMNDRYQLANVHFHWGANDSLGAEHVINKHRYSMEVHVVHYNLKYENVQEALNHTDGIAVIAIFYKASSHHGLAGLQNVSDALPEITEPDTETEIENFRLSSLLNGRKQKTYYTYAGSLTTPPCSEAVTWIIFPKPVSVRSDQLEPFRTLIDNEGNPLVNNFRELQPLNGRKIYEGRNKKH